MYVRRKITTLSDDDLENTLDAMSTLWSTTDEDGQELYGSQRFNNNFIEVATITWSPYNFISFK